MSKCKKCNKTKCNCHTSCDDICVGCLQQLSTECIYLENKLTCFEDDLPKGTDLSKVFEAVCNKFTEIDEAIENVDVDVTASDVTVTNLACLTESEVGEGTVQDALEALCTKITTIESSLTNISATQITIEPSDCIDESDVENMTLQDGLNAICNILTNINETLEDLQECCVDDADWFKVGTTTAPTLITDDMFHTGKVGIGVGMISPDKVLDVIGNVKFLADDEDYFFLGEDIDTSAMNAGGFPPDLRYLYGHFDNPGSKSGIFGSAERAHIEVVRGSANNHEADIVLWCDVAGSVPSSSITLTASYSTDRLVARLEETLFVISQNSDDLVKFDNDQTLGNTSMLLYDVDAGTLVRVSVGAADSGGTGFKVLRVPN